MKIDDKTRLFHMIEAAEDAVSFLSKKTFDDLLTDRQLAFAVIRALEIVGEAAAQITQESRELHSNVKWRDIVSMRNKLINAYFDINYNIVWAAVKEEIPKLLPELKKIIDEC